MNRLFVIGSLGALAGCDPEALTFFEAMDALEQVSRSDQGDEATGDVITFSTSFTLGGAVEQAAEELAAFWESQAPCTTVSIAQNVVTTDYGTLDDACTWKGKTYAGFTELTIAAASLGDVEVEHAWTGFTDGRVQVDGGALVVWDGSALTRQVATEHTWTDLASGEEVDVTGQHELGTLEGPSIFEGGITLDGDRQWIGADEGLWDLTFTGVEARWIDPAPQAGEFVVTTPAGKDLTITFSRVDDTTIEAALTGTRRDWVFHIGALGQIESTD